MRRGRGRPAAALVTPQGDQIAKGKNQRHTEGQGAGEHNLRCRSHDNTHTQGRNHPNFAPDRSKMPAQNSAQAKTRAARCLLLPNRHTCGYVPPLHAITTTDYVKELKHETYDRNFGVAGHRARRIRLRGRASEARPRLLLLPPLPVPVRSPKLVRQTWPGWRSRALLRLA